MYINNYIVRICLLCYRYRNIERLHLNSKFRLISVSVYGDFTNRKTPPAIMYTSFKFKSHDIYRVISMFCLLFVCVRASL